MTKIIYDTKLSVNARFIMMALLIQENDSVEISIDGLCEISNFSRNTVMKALKELELNNYISKIKRGQGKSNIYKIEKGN